MILLVLTSKICCFCCVVVDSGRVEEVTGSIVAEVDIPTSRHVLASLDIVGTVGCAKLHVPKSKPVLICL